MTEIPTPFSLAFPVPGAPFNQNYINNMIQFGARIRDQFMWQYPILPGAYKAFVEISATREWRLSGSKSGVARANEYIHGAEARQHDGLIDRGLDQLVRRWSADYLAIGRIMATASDGKPLRYLDPAWMSYNIQDRRWYESWTSEYYPAESIMFHHPLPLGIQGYFVSPLSFVLPTAMMAWLIQEHDMAEADGRKLRDILIIKGEELSKQLVQQIDNVMKMWTGADPTKLNLSAIWMDAGSPDKASEVISRVGLANIPEGLDREKFTMLYVNVIAAAIGLSMRHFYSGQENGTNRSLEEVQEARQQLKGPSAFVRSIQRMLNDSGCLKQFGRNTRFAFVEEVDTQSLESRATVLFKYAQSFAIFVKSLGGTVSIEGLVAWLQSDGILPADLEIITTAVTQVNALQESDPAVGTNPADTIAQSDPVPSTNAKSLQNDSAKLDYGEVSIDQDGRIVETRSKIISLDKLLLPKVNKKAEKETIDSFNDMLIKARSVNLEKFLNFKGWTDEDRPEVERISGVGVPTEEDYRVIRKMLDEKMAV